MTLEHKEKLLRFVRDTAMVEAVRQQVLNSFLKRRPNTDVNVLAASRLAIDMLDEAWTELQSLKPTDKEQAEPTPNVGL